MEPDYKELYLSLKTFHSLSYDDNEMKSYLRSKEVDEDCHNQIYFLIKHFCAETKTEIDKFCIEEENKDFVYIKIIVDKLPKNLLTMLYKFLLLQEESFLQDQERAC